MEENKISRVALVQMNAHETIAQELYPQDQYLIYYEDGYWYVKQCTGRQMTRDLETVKMLKEDTATGTGYFANWDTEHGFFIVKKHPFSDYMNAPVDNYEDDLK